VARCKGKSRQSGERCKLPPTPGTDFCRFHGGRVPRGAAHHAYKDGSRSRFSPPATLLEDYERSRRDPKLTMHGDSIALIDAMIQHALNEFEEGGASELWRELSRTWRRAEAARAAQDKRKWQETYAQVGTLIERGVAQVGREGKLMSLLEHRRKQVDSETRRRKVEANIFTAEEAAAFYTGLGETVRRYVLNPNLTPEERLERIKIDMVALAERHGVRDGAGGNAEAE
jgi:hypothetical protein